MNQGAFPVGDDAQPPAGPAAGGDAAAAPSDDECLKSGAARAYRKYLDRTEMLRTTVAWARPISPCVSCARNTGIWCDDCEDAGRTFTMHIILPNTTTIVQHDFAMVGSPLCSVCDNERVCRVCQPGHALFQGGN